MEGVITGSSFNANRNTELDHLEPLQRQVMMLVHGAPLTNEGVHIQTIAQSIQAPSASVLHAIEQLTTEGLLYTTIDDDHVNRFLASLIDML